MICHTPQESRVLRKRAGFELHELATAMRVDLNELHEIETALLWPNEQIATHYHDTLRDLRRQKRKQP